MKFSSSTIFFTLAAAALSQVAASSAVNTVDECGGLGVMEVPEILPKALIPQPFASALDIRSGSTGPDLVTIVSKVSFVVLALRQAQPLVVKWKAV
ncbi:hypothetical protein B0H13DRAFT_2327868 [Mycena leptocephala]|nr:hypothetical protein B0H13DRAFT_2327868 [Mycena leptocephala]